MRVSSAGPEGLDLLGQYGQVSLLSKAEPTDPVRLTSTTLSAELVWLSVPSSPASSYSFLPSTAGFVDPVYLGPLHGHVFLLTMA